MRHEGEVRGDYMAYALIQSKSKSFWDEARKCRHRKSNLPNTVDGVQWEENIAWVFANKFERSTREKKRDNKLTGHVLLH